MDDETITHALGRPNDFDTAPVATTTTNSNINNNHHITINNNEDSFIRNFLRRVTATMSRAMSVANAADTMSTQALLMHCESMTMTAQAQMSSIETIGDILALGDNGLATAAVAAMSTSSTQDMMIINNY